MLAFALLASCSFFFFFNDTATTEIYTLSYTTLFRSLAGEHALRVDGAVQGERGAYGEPDRLLVRHRERTGQPQADGADVRVGRRPEGCGAAAEHLRVGAQLHVRLEPDHRLPRVRPPHHASSAAGNTRSIA